MFATPAAGLAAAARGARAALVAAARAAAALTSFLGWSAEQVAAADDADWEELHRRCTLGALSAPRRGGAARVDHATEGLPERVLAPSAASAG